MSTRLCPACGGLVSTRLDWCGQCFTRLDEPSSRAAPSAEAPPGPMGGVEAGARAEAATRAPSAAGAPTSDPGLCVEDGKLLWSCPACTSENPLDARACTRCGKLFEEQEPPPPVTAERAAALSLLFPGVGHIAGMLILDGARAGP